MLWYIYITIVARQRANAKGMKAMTRIIVLVKLKPGKVPADYERWARTTDLPTVNALRSVDAFTLHRATGQLGSDAAPPCDYVEIIDIADMALFGEETATEAMGRIAREFQDWSDPVFIVTAPVGDAA